MRPGRRFNVIRTAAALGFTLLVSSSVAFAQRGYVRSDGINSVVYKGADYHIYELFLDSFGWHRGDLTAEAGAPLGSTNYYTQPVPYVRSDGFNAVVYTGADGHIHELALYSDGWGDGDLFVQAGIPGGDENIVPAPYVRSDGFNVVLYRARNGHIYEIALYPSGWGVGDLTAQAGAPLAYRDLLGPAPYVRSDGFNAVVYIGGNWHIYELALYPSGWGVGDLTAQAGAHLADSVPAPYVRSDGFNAVVYGSGHIYELTLHPSGGWVWADLNDQAGGM
jgi:hypothetical protein